MAAETRQRTSTVSRGAANNRDTGSTGVYLASLRLWRRGLEKSLSPRRANLLLLGSFAVLAFTLALIGIYGVIAYAAGQRIQEIGVLMALEAQQAAVLALVVTHAAKSIWLACSLAWLWLWRSQDPRRTALWDYYSRSSHFGRCRCSLGLRWSAGLLYSCPSHGQGRSHRSIAIRVTADP